MNISLSTRYFGNSLEAYLVSAGFLVVGWVGVWILHHVLLVRLKAWAATTETKMDDFLIQALEKTIVPLVYVSILLAAVKGLTLPLLIQKSLAFLWALVVMIAGVRVALGIMRHFIFGVWLVHREDRSSLERTVKAVIPVVTIAVWGLGLILLLDNLGFKISAVMAGLGIGGVAIALAAQTILGDVFGYLVIMFDKPFEIDDFIIAGDFMGTIERIGIKTTRVRSLGGEQLIISNHDLTDSRIRNYKRMQIRRIVFKLGITYDTSHEKLQKAVALAKDAVQQTSSTQFDRAHFSSYGDFNLVIEVVYYVQSADYNKYMDVQQEINFRIKQSYEKEGIEFAFPTQTIHLAKP